MLPERLHEGLRKATQRRQDDPRAVADAPKIPPTAATCVGGVSFPDLAASPPRDSPVNTDGRGGTLPRGGVQVHCPACRSDYREGIMICAECGARLVDPPPVENENENEGGGPAWVPVFSTADSSLLIVVKSALEAGGIPFTVRGEGGMRLFPMGRFAVGVKKRVLGAVIVVPADRAGEARDFLASFERDPLVADPDEPADEG